MITHVETDDHFRIKEAAEYLGVTQAAIRVAIHEKRLPLVEDRGVKWIPKQAVYEYRERTNPAGNRGKGRPKGARDLKRRKVRQQRGGSDA
jgi:excisionase family DNA binding protein